MKYFLLSIFSSALLLFGFSYLYGTDRHDQPRRRWPTRWRGPAPGAAGLALMALVMVTAGLGFRITAVPFHFYAPDVYQGTTPAAAALLAFVPKVAGFAALLRVFGFTLGLLDPGQAFVGQILGGQGLMLLWILAAVTMTLGNVLALLQDNIKRLLAYSSVAHAGYMLVGLAAAPLLGGSAPVAGVEAVLFYLVAYGAMTVGAFAVIVVSEHAAKAGRDGGRPGRPEREPSGGGAGDGAVPVQPDRHAADGRLRGQVPAVLRGDGRAARDGHGRRFAVAGVVHRAGGDRRSSTRPSAAGTICGSRR